jgi:hypothetical protein
MGRVTVLPVPVAPAARPCRFIMARDSLTGASCGTHPETVEFPVDYRDCELNGGAFQGVALLDRGGWI